MAERSYQKNRSAERDYSASRDYQLNRGSAYNILEDPLFDDYASSPLPSPFTTPYTGKPSLDMIDKEELGFPIDGKFKSMHDMSHSELMSHEILYKRSGEPVPNVWRANVESLVPVNIPSLAWETLIMGASVEEPVAAVIGGLAAPAAVSMAKNVGKSMLQNRRRLIQQADDIQLQENLFRELTSITGVRNPRNIGLPANYMRAIDSEITRGIASRNMNVAEARVANRRINEIRDAFDDIQARATERYWADDLDNTKIRRGKQKLTKRAISNRIHRKTGVIDESLEYAEDTVKRRAGKPIPIARRSVEKGGPNVLKGDKASQKYNKAKITAGDGEESYNLVIKKGNSVTQLIRKNADPNNSSYSFSIANEKGQGSARIQFNVNKAAYDGKTGKALHEGESVPVLSGFQFYSSDKRGAVQAGKLVKELIRRLPKGAVIEEQSMTIDSLLLLLKTATKEKAKIMFSSGSRAGANPSTKSAFSKYINKANRSSMGAQEKAYKDFIDHVDNMLSKSNVVGKPDFKVTSSGGFTYNTVKIQKVMGIAATSLGFKNYDEFEKFLNYDPNSVESKIFDDEILF